MLIYSGLLNVNIFKMYLHVLNEVEQFGSNLVLVVQPT